MCSELTSRTRKAFTEWSNRQFACFDPYLTRCRCQTTNIIPAWTACFLLFVQLKACSPWLKGTDDALALPNRWGCAATWPWETREKQTCVSLASLSMLSPHSLLLYLFTMCFGLFDFHIHHTVPTHAATFPMTHKSPYPYRNCKELHFLVILLLNSHNLSTPTIYCLHSSMHRPHTVRARALCFL